MTSSRNGFGSVMRSPSCRLLLPLKTGLVAGSPDRAAVILLNEPPDVVHHTCLSGYQALCVKSIGSWPRASMAIRLPAPRKIRILFRYPHAVCAPLFDWTQPHRAPL